jgi:DNA-nicking Smr family endonuclease
VKGHGNRLALRTRLRPARIGTMVPGKPTGDHRPDGSRDSLDEEEQRMFEREFAGVRPWRRGAHRISSVDFPADQDQPGSAGPFRGSQASRLPDPNPRIEVQSDGVSGTAFGVSRETASALRRGEFRFEARCDLHKLRAEAARKRLSRFVEECTRRKIRAALVICGRGLHSGPEGPVLARLVAETLASPPMASVVLAFAPAPADQGGPGAVAVLFRRR